MRKVVESEVIMLNMLTDLSLETGLIKKPIHKVAVEEYQERVIQLVVHTHIMDNNIVIHISMVDER